MQFAKVSSFKVYSVFQSLKHSYTQLITNSLLAELIAFALFTFTLDDGVGRCQLAFQIVNMDRHPMMALRKK